MVRNSEKKMTRKIRKNRQTRRKRVLKMKTKFRKNRMHKTMKGGYKTLRENLKSTGELGPQINLHLNLIANSIAEKKSADENPQGGNFIRCYKIEIELTARKQEWTPVTPAVTPAADSTPMIQFIPDSFLGEIRYPIQVLIQGISTEYSKLCSSTSSNRMNPCGEGYQLTPDKFKEMLHKVCMGEVHNRKCFGGTCSFINYGITNFNKLQTSLSNMYNMLEKPNPDYSNHNTTFGSIPSPPEGNKLNFTIMLQLDQLDQLDQSDRVSLSVSSSVLRIYSQLNTLLNNDLLNPDKIICKACTIVMPPFKKKSVYIGHNAHLLSPITYGYNSLTIDPAFTWEGLGNKQLEPNSYCAVRKYIRVMMPVGSTPDYTMSPVVIPRELLPPESLPHYDIQSQHQSWLDNMEQMLANLDRNISKKDMLKKTFDKDNKVEITHIFDENEIYYYYELTIQQTTITVKSEDNSDTNIAAVIIEFKVFSEDGKCSKELIFVSYKRPSSLADAFSMPGQILHDNYEPVQVSPQTMNKAIHTLFIQKFMELLYSIGKAPSDNVVLSLTDSAGQLVERGPTSEISNTQQTILEPVLPGSTYNGICTIILKNSGNTFGLSVAKATNNQIAAFHAVNKHIETDDWKPYGHQTTFQINNNKTGVDEIKVTVRILTVDAQKLISATYQGQDAVPYLLFANKEKAAEYIRSKMMI
jgi:hypothetical protein